MARFDGQAWRGWRVFGQGPQVASVNLASRAGYSLVEVDIPDRAAYEAAFPVRPGSIRIAGHPIVYSVQRYKDPESLGPAYLELSPALISPVEVGDPSRARRLVQTVDILGDQVGHAAVGFQCGERGMGRAGTGPGNARPAHRAARPVSLAHTGAADEVGVLHGPRVLPAACIVTIGRNAGGRAAAGPGQHQQARVPVAKLRHT